jgi:hypothetical protein
MYPSKITVTKSLTKEKSKEWRKAEFTVEVALGEDDPPEMAKDWAETLVDLWIEKFEKKN